MAPLPIQETLTFVLSKLQGNLTQARAQLAQARAQATQVDEPTLAACKIVLEKFGSPQAATQVIASVGNIDILTALENELMAMIASTQNTLANDVLIQNTAKQVAANTEALKVVSPLSAAGGAVGASPAPVANNVTSITPESAQAGVPGVSGPANKALN